MVNQPMRKVDPFFRRKEFLQIEFDFFGGTVLREPQQIRNPPYMSIDDNPARNSERRPQQDVRRLPPDSRQFGQFFQSSGEFSPVLLDNCLCHSPQARRLRPEEPQRMDDLLDFFLGRFGKLLRRRKLLEQFGRDRIHPFVRALSRKDRRREELKRILMDQRTFRIAVMFAQLPSDPQSPL